MASSGPDDPSADARPDRSSASDAGVRSLLVDQRRLAERHIVALTRTFDEIVSAAEDIATDDEHDPEGHTLAFERQQVAGLLSAARRKLDEVVEALDRLDLGYPYGTCAGCGRPIGRERLAAMPATGRCIVCASTAR